MLIALYIVSLAASSGLVAVFGRDVLAELGFIANFQTGFLATVAIAAAYAATQCAYMTLLRFLEPSRTGTPYFTEVLSHLSAVALLPYLAGIDVAWPHEVIYRVEPLVYLGVFGAAHLFFKLMSYYASLQGELGSRWSPLFWLGATGVCALVAVIGANRWVTATEAATPKASDETHYYRVRDQYAVGRRIAEGAVYRWDAAGLPGESLTFRWALPPSSDSEIEIDTVYATINLYGDETKDYHTAVPVSADGWTTMQVPTTAFPANVKYGEVRWARHEIPSWQRLLGINPLVFGDFHVADTEIAVRPSLVMSGPHIHQSRPETSQLSFLIILVDGLSGQRLSSFGYENRTTPQLDAFTAVSTKFTSAYTPSLDTHAALQAMFTGVTPLRQPERTTNEGENPTPPPALPALLREGHYATGAFFETADNDLGPGAGIERGFEIVHAVESVAPTDDVGPLRSSYEIAERAKEWISDHLEEKFFGVVRLRGLINTMETGPVSSERYDEAVAAADVIAGDLIKHVRNLPTRRTTCVIVAAPCGYEPGAPNSPLRLSEPVLHVPWIMHVPGYSRATRSDLVGLEDIAPTLALIGEVTLPRTIDGKHILNGPNGNRPIGVAGEPPTLSLRTEDWRYTWASDAAAAAGPVGLFRVSSRDGWWTADVTSRDRARAQRYREELEAYLERQKNRRAN